MSKFKEKEYLDIEEREWVFGVLVKGAREARERMRKINDDMSAKERLIGREQASFVAMLSRRDKLWAILDWVEAMDVDGEMRENVESIRKAYKSLRP